MKKAVITMVLLTAMSATGMSLTACNEVKGKLTKLVNNTTKEETVAHESNAPKAAEVMNLFIEDNDSQWQSYSNRMGLKCIGKGMPYENGQTVDLYAKGIAYDQSTHIYNKVSEDGIGLAMITDEVDGTLWELMLADKSDYDALIAELEGEKDYKEDTEMLKSLNESPDFHLDRVFMKAVYDAELSEMAGKRLGIGYYIMFEGERNGLYVVSFSHGNGDVEME